MATHSTVLALRIPGTAEPGGLPSMGLHRVGHDWNDLAIFHCVYVPQLSYPFVYWWTSRLLPCPGCYKQCCDEHWGTCVSLNSSFLCVYAQQWDWWVIWQFYFQFFKESPHCSPKRLSTMRETRVRSLGWEDPLEKEMAIHSSTIAWKIPGTEELGRLQSMGSQRVGHNWATSLHLQCSP